MAHWRVTVAEADSWNERVLQASLASTYTAMKVNQQTSEGMNAVGLLCWFVLVPQMTGGVGFPGEVTEN